LKAYQADIAKFEQTNTQVLGISVDSFAANRRFKDAIDPTGAYQSCSALPG